MTKTKILEKSKPKKSSQANKVSPSQGNKIQWDSLQTQLRNKVDYKVRYYFTGHTTQAQRDWIARSFFYYNNRAKRDKAPAADIVNAGLHLQVAGFYGNMTAEDAPAMTFKTAKHIFSMVDYIRNERVDHGNVAVHMSVDDAPFIPIL